MKEVSLKSNIVLNAIKQACTIIFPLITFPYVSRVLGTEAYGKYSFGYTYVNYFILFAALGTSTYAIREGAKIRDDKKRISTFADDIFSINVITMILSYAILFTSIALWNKLEAYIWLIIVQSSAIFLNTIGTDWMNSIYEDFRYISLRYIAFQIIAVILMFLFVKKSEDYIVFAAINVFANAGPNLLNIIYTRKKYLKVKFRVSKTLKVHIIPLIILFSNTLAVSIYVNSDITLLGIFSTDESVGIYTLAAKIYNIVKQILNAAIVVIIPRIAYYLGKNEIKKYNAILNQTIHGLIVLILPAITGLAALAADVVFLCGGKDYYAAQEPLKFLCLALCFSVLGCFFSNAILIVNKMEKLVLKVTILSAISNIVLNLFFIPTLDMTGAAITTVIAELIVFSVSCFQSRDYWKVNFSFRFIFSCIVGCIIMFIYLKLVTAFWTGMIVRMFFSIIGGTLIYAISLVIFKNEIALYGLSILRKWLFRRGHAGV